MLRGIALAVAVISLIVAIALAVLQALAPSIVRHAIEGRVRAICPACSVDLGHIDARLVSGRAFATGARIATDPNQRVVVQARIDHIDVELSWPSLLTGRPRVHWIRVRGAHLTVIEDPTRPAQSEDIVRSGPPPRVVVDHTVLDNADFEYVRLAPHGRATLRADRVSIHASAFGLRAGLAPRWLDVRISARVAESGELTGALTIDPFSRAGDVRGELQMHGLDIDRLDTYLRAALDVRAHGEAVAAATRFDMDRGRLRLHLAGRYRDFTMQFIPHQGQGPLVASVKDAGGRAVYRRNVGMDEPEGWADVVAMRDSRQGIFEVVWRALTEATQRIARGRH